MEVYTVNSRCAAFSLSSCTLINENDAAEIVRKLLEEHLLEQWDSIHIDVFASGKSVLYLAHPGASLKVSIAPYALAFLEEYFTE